MLHLELPVKPQFEASLTGINYAPRRINYAPRAVNYAIIIVRASIMMIVINNPHNKLIL